MAVESRAEPTSDAHACENVIARARMFVIVAVDVDTPLFSTRLYVPYSRGGERERESARVRASKSNGLPAFKRVKYNFRAKRRTALAIHYRRRL